jgi:hypothetical protein
MVRVPFVHDQFRLGACREGGCREIDARRVAWPIRTQMKSLGHGYTVVGVFAAMLSLGWLVVGIVGIVQSQWPLVALGIGMSAFFALCSWWLSPLPPARLTNKALRQQTAFFRWLGIKWLIPPDNESDGPPDS